MRLGDIGGIKLEFRSALLFGLAALLLSFITGIAAGNNPLYALAKSLVLTAVFAGLGYGAVIILRRFVPELVDLIDSSGKVGGGDESDIPVSENASAVSGSGESGEAEERERKPDAELEKEFEPFKSGDLKHFSGVDGEKEGSMGRHYMKEEKTVKYEPKIIAAAIRTMMSRDKD